MPEFFSLVDALEFHAEQIELYGGRHGVRDKELLESALAMPISGCGGNYFHVFPFEMAAAYLFHIVRDHPFLDGNKRTGLAACLYFLEFHGIEIEAEPDELERFVRSVAAGQVFNPEIAEFLEKNSRPIP
jgi:death-on-curing protein